MKNGKQLALIKCYLSKYLTAKWLLQVLYVYMQISTVSRRRGRSFGISLMIREIRQGMVMTGGVSMAVSAFKDWVSAAKWADNIVAIAGGTLMRVPQETERPMPRSGRR